MFKDILTNITAEGIAVVGLVTIAVLALIKSPDPETIVIAIAAGLVGYVKGTTKSST